MVARGPLYLGKEALLLSFLLGVAGLAMTDRSTRRMRLLTLFVAVAHLMAWALLLRWNAAEGRRLMSLGSV